MIVQFHIQECDKPENSEFIAQSEFNEDWKNALGQNVNQWSGALAEENRDLIEESGGKLQFMVCDESSPHFFVECGVGDSGIKQITKRRNLTTEATP